MESSTSFFLCSRWQSRRQSNMDLQRTYFVENIRGLFFYVHGSVHHESNLISVQQDVTYSVYYISVGSSTCFGY